jgi:hypothetical protein
MVKRLLPCRFTSCMPIPGPEQMCMTSEVCARETTIHPSHMILGPYEEYQIRLPRCIAESHNDYFDFGTIDPK